MATEIVKNLVSGENQKFEKFINTVLTLSKEISSSNNKGSTQFKIKQAHQLPQFKRDLTRSIENLSRLISGNFEEPSQQFTTDRIFSSQFASNAIPLRSLIESVAKNTEILQSFESTLSLLKASSNLGFFELSNSLYSHVFEKHLGGSSVKSLSVAETESLLSVVDSLNREEFFSREETR